ncbi:hypothetical protein [Acetobacterium wieringae]|uniref:Lipoprotein n=1 Tax=Acetobacterium wieringae TaxID=52694 RepID=A0A1F2PCF2_9FIRM|nr:hypothetical protein [Acetobacterium wieringae]OFV68928.1 hypothetical protein ACWI_36190 [Acetobacterium wieringae]
MKFPHWLKISIVLLFLVNFTFIACSGVAEAKGSSVSVKPSVSKPSVSTCKPSVSTSKPSTSSKPSNASSSSSTGKTNVTSSYKPATTITYSTKSVESSSYYAFSNKKFDFSRPYKSLKNYDYSTIMSSTFYYRNSFLSNYLDYLIIQNLLNDEEDDDKNNDAWLLMYMIFK